ncbi:MAG: hypothetical protein ACI4EN_07155 [Butyrivibrio sp.]
MKLSGKIICIFLTAIMLIGIGGCKPKGGKTTEDSKTDFLNSGNMLMAAVKKEEDTKVFYFIDTKTDVRKYTGYRYMDDFVNGISLVSVRNDDYSGDMLIDTDENIIARYDEIKKIEFDDRLFYQVKDSNKNYGILDEKGNIILECKYTYVEIEDEVRGFIPDNYLFMAQNNDNSVEIYKSDRQLLYTVPAGSVDRYFSDLYLRESRDGIVEIFYGDTAKFFHIESGKEVDEEFAGDFDGGLSLDKEVGKLVFYNEKLEKVQEIQTDASVKKYKRGISLGRSFYVVYYDIADSKDEMTDVYDTKGKLLLTLPEKSFDGLIKLSTGEYLKVINDEGKRALINSAGEEVFSTDKSNEINQSYVDTIFYTQGDGSIVIYSSENFKEVTDKKYTACEGTVLFMGESSVVFNEYGDKKEADISEVEYNGVDFLPGGYVSICLDGYTIIDVSGSGEDITVPKGTEFNRLVPCYKLENRFYDFQGTLILDEDNLD